MLTGNFDCTPILSNWTWPYITHHALGALSVHLDAFPTLTSDVGGGIDSLM